MPRPYLWCLVVAAVALIAPVAFAQQLAPQPAQQFTAEDFLRLQRIVQQQEQRLQDLETTRLPPIDGPHDTSLVLDRFDDDKSDEGDEDDEGFFKLLGPASSKTTQKWTGRVHYDQWVFGAEDPLISFLDTGDPAVGPLDFSGFRRLRLGMAGDITDTMLYKIEFDFGAPGSLAIKDAYLGWDELAFFGTVLIGQQKRPYGLDHLNSSRYNVFMERPFHVEAINQDARRIGLQAYTLSDDQRWNIRYGVFLMDDLSKSGGQYTDNYQSELAGRLANTIWYDETSGGRGYAHWAVSGSLAFPGGGPDARFTTRPEARTQGKWLDTGSIAGGKRYQHVGLEGVVNVGPWQLVAEYQGINVNRTAASDLQFFGGYVYLSYFLTGEHVPWTRKSGTIGRVKPFENFFLVNRCCGGSGYGLGAWQVAVRYSHADFTDQDIFGGIGNSLTFGLNWWWTSNSRMQLNYINGQIDHRAAVGGAPLAPGLPFKGEYDIVGTRFMVDF